MTNLKTRLQHLQDRIQRACDCCDRDPATVELLPVSKFHSIEAVQEAASLGLRTFAENYVQAGAAKAEALPDLDFVLIGPLQRNKAKPALAHFKQIMTVDRPELVSRLRTLAHELNVQRHIWIQVDLWDEATKMGGCSSADLQTLVDSLKGDVRLPLAGFMAIPPPGRSTAFAEMAQLRQDWQQKLGKPLRLSMGMSEDLEKAIQAGSDQVRVGTALFGERG